MNVVNGLVPLICLASWASATPITMMLFDNWGRHYLAPIGRWTRIARSDQSGQASGEYSNDYGTSGQGGFEPSTGHLDNGHDFQQYGQASHFDESHGDLGGHDFPVDNHVHEVPVSEHVEVTKPVAVPVYKEIGVPVPQPVKIHIPHPVAVGVPQPYPVAVPVSHPVPIQIIKTIAVPVEKKVPYPVEKHIPVPVEKPVPITIERHIPIPVEKPYPVKIPVYKTIYHHAKSHGHH